MPKKIDVPDGFAWCSRCKKPLFKALFDPAPKRRSGVERYCKVCRGEYRRQRLGQRALVIPPEGKLWCSRCEKVKDKSEFSPAQSKPSKGRNIRRTGYCRVCMHEIVYHDKPTFKKTIHGFAHHSCKPADPVSGDPLKLSYVAGVFDAEGSAQLMTGKNVLPVLSFHSDNTVLLEAVKAVVGGKINYYKRQKPDRKTGKMIWVSNGRLTIHRLAGVRDVSAAITPFLKLKGERCDIVAKAVHLAPFERQALRPRLDELNAVAVKYDIQCPEIRQLDKVDVAGIPDTELAYLAGVIDGDGWIGLGKREVIISVSTAKPQTVLELCPIFGGKMRLAEIRNEDQGDSYIWKISADKEAMICILDRLEKFLTLKRQHAIWAREAIVLPEIEQRVFAKKMSALTKVHRSEKFTRIGSPVPPEEVADSVDEEIA